MVTSEREGVKKAITPIKIIHKKIAENDLVLFVANLDKKPNMKSIIINLLIPLQFTLIYIIKSSPFFNTTTYIQKIKIV